MEKNLIQGISNKNRQNILILLDGEALDLKNLVSKLGLESDGVLKHLDVLKSSGLVEKNSEMYSSTSLGSISIPQIKTSNFILKHKDFFSEHTLGDTPNFLVSQIGNLSESKIKSPIVSCFEIWKQIIHESNDYFYGIFSEPPLLIGDVVLKKLGKIDLKFIFDKNQKFLEKSEFVQTLNLNKYSNDSPIQRKIHSSCSVNVLLNEKSACILFPDKSGVTDFDKLFFSNDSLFHKWCVDFFNHKWNESETISKVRTIPINSNSF